MLLQIIARVKRVRDVVTNDCKGNDREHVMLLQMIARVTRARDVVTNDCKGYEST